MEKALRKLPLIMALTASAVYLSLIFNDNVWVDEAFTAVLVRGSFKEMMARSAADTLPPLYNILAWLMTEIFGYGTLQLKLTSVIPLISLFFFSAYKLTELYNEKTAALYIFCLAAAPHMLHYGVEIRMYSLCLSFTSVAAVYALEYCKKRSFRSLMFLCLFTLLSSFSHHYGLIALLFIWLDLAFFILIRDRSQIKQFLSAAVITALLHIPYLILTLYQIKNASSYFSSGDSPYSGFFSSLRFPFVTNITPLSALLLAAVVFFAFFGSRVREGLALLTVYIEVLLLSYAMMIVTGRVFFTARYLVPSLGLLWLGFSLSVCAGQLRLPVSSPKADKIAILSVILLMTITAVTGYAMQFKEEYAPGVSQMLEFFDENLSPDDGYIIYESNYEIEWCMRYYEPSLIKYDPSDIENIKGNIWYFEVPGFEKELDDNVLSTYNKVYKGAMSFDRYQFNLYELVRY